MSVLLGIRLGGLSGVDALFVLVCSNGLSMGGKMERRYGYREGSAWASSQLPVPGRLGHARLPLRTQSPASHC